MFLLVLLILAKHLIELIIGNCLRCYLMTMWTLKLFVYLHFGIVVRNVLYDGRTVYQLAFL